MSLLKKILPNNVLVSPAVRNFRHTICYDCQFKNGKFCGKPVVGNTVEYKGKQIHLCGCIINEKIELKNQDCPANKW